MSIQDQFEAFHAANPHVFDLLVKYTQRLRDSGRKHYSINAVFERIRWHLNVEIRGDEEFKLNNNYRSRYVRLLETEHPEFTGFYRTRELKAA